MKRKSAVVAISVVALLIVGGGVWYAYQKGYLRPSADVVAPSVDYASQATLQKGEFSSTEISNGKIQLKTVAQ